MNQIEKINELYEKYKDDLPRATKLPVLLILMKNHHYVLR